MRYSKRGRAKLSFILKFSFPRFGGEDVVCSSPGFLLWDCLWSCGSQEMSDSETRAIAATNRDDDDETTGLQVLLLHGL